MEATAQGLTVVDLADTWAPHPLTDAPSLRERGEQTYRRHYAALADRRFDRVEPGHRAHHDQYLELFDIPPSLRVLRQRLTEGERHACHDRVDDGAFGDRWSA
ncbi:MAG: hypothetical protein AAGA56_02300 [Myxococcota bacterium]